MSPHVNYLAMDMLTACGKGPLCAFLDKRVPPKPFPSGNTGPEFDKRFANLMRSQKSTAIRNVIFLIGSVIILSIAFWLKY